METNALIENLGQRWTVCDCKKKEEKMWKNRDIYREGETGEDPSKAVLQLFAGCFFKVFLQRRAESEVERR